ncbi:MAG: thiopurine S-methyltransferase [Pseudomonas sp.]|nr:thiopurine S-methyltransferase [Pseudomonas sp.]
MEEGFWQTRWQRNQIGFHLQEVNPGLKEYWQCLQVPKGHCVFVPLCGKSLDLCWLAEQGYSVLGVELIEKAVVDFFAEQQLLPTITQQGVFKRYTAGAITILCGDFFALTVEDLSAVDAFYDRAALIALPDELRRCYAVHLSAHLPQRCKGLLMTLDYPQAEMKGPPFAVAPEQVEQLLSDTFIIECMESRDILEQEQRFKNVGITRLFDYVYCVRQRAALV